MGLTHSPRIVTDGLVLALDAANVKSYGGSGTTWTDLSGKGNNGTINGSPSYTSTSPKYFTLVQIVNIFKFLMIYQMFLKALLLLG